MGWFNKNKVIVSKEDAELLKRAKLKEESERIHELRAILNEAADLICKFEAEKFSMVSKSKCNTGDLVYKNIFTKFTTTWFGNVSQYGFLWKYPENLKVLAVIPYTEQIRDRLTDWNRSDINNIISSIPDKDIVPEKRDFNVQKVKESLNFIVRSKKLKPIWTLKLDCPLQYSLPEDFFVKVDSKYYKKIKRLEKLEKKIIELQDKRIQLEDELNSLFNVQ